MKLEDYILPDGDPDVVATLELEILVNKGKGENRIIEIPLGPDSNDITFDKLEEMAFDHYYENYDNDDTYGMTYKIIELQINMFVIKARYMAAEFGVMKENGKLVEFDTKELTQLWGRANLEGISYLASWEVISKEDAKRENLL